MTEKEISLQVYKDFLKKVYSDENIIGNKLSVMTLVTDKNFRGNSYQRLLGVYDGEILVCAALAIIHKNNKEQVVLGFFEALPDCKLAVDSLIEYAIELGREKGVNKIVIGMEGHCNNGLGFPLEYSKTTFGESQSPSYYHDYFEDFEKLRLSSFREKAENIKLKLLKDMEILKGKEDISLEFADFSLKGFRNTLEIYTNLNNKIFCDHRYYFPREYQEDYELFNTMRPLLKKENLIFAKSENKYIGFVLWYPDFNELAGDDAVGIKTFVKYRVLGQKIAKVKVVEIGVLPEFQNKGAIVMLLDKALKSTGKHGEEVISSWILEDNRSSLLITKRYCKNMHKGYCYYEKEI